MFLSDLPFFYNLKLIRDKSVTLNGYFILEPMPNPMNSICRYGQTMVEAAGFEPASENIAT